MSPCTSFHVWCMGVFLLAPISLAHSLELPEDEEIETLEVIEITGTVVEQTPRDLNFSMPDIQGRPHGHQNEYLTLPQRELVQALPTSSMVLLDQTATTRKILTPVTPLKTERPPYPRRAREQGWHGRVILRLEVLSDGTIESSSIHKSSGYQLLDNHALKAADQWTFQPAKNGGFPVSATVNLPIQFDLIK